MMKFSVIIPVYNCIEYLEACVGSIFAVGIPEMEILMVDDGATDGSGQLCDRLAEAYAEVRVIHQPNGGVSAARNRGIREAKGEYLLFVDSDDTVDASALADLLDRFLQTGADVAVFGLSFDFYRAGKLYRSEHVAYAFDGSASRPEWASEFEKLFDANALSSSCTKILKRDVLERLGLKFREDMFLYEDLEFVLRYLAVCDRILFDSRPIYRYRQSEDEGNAGRRLARLKSIPEFLVPIEAAMEALPEEVSAQARRNVLRKLYGFLTHGKIAISTPAQIREICREHNRWPLAKDLERDDVFWRRLREEKAVALYLAARKTQIRHKIAVPVKAALRKLRK